MQVQSEVQEGSVTAAAERFGVGAGHRELVQDLSHFAKTSHQVGASLCAGAGG